MLRIAFIIDTLAAPGGTERQLLALLAGLDRSRFEPRLFCLRGSDWLRSAHPDLAWTDLGIHVSANLKLPVGLFRLARMLRNERVDVLQTHFRDANMVGILAASLARTPAIVSTRRGVPYWHSPAGLRLLRLLNLRVTRFMANAEATREHFAALERIAPERFDVIPNGIDASQFRGADDRERRKIREAVGLSTEHTVFCLVGNLRPVKGVPDFIEAAALVAFEHPGARFLIAGQGAERVTLERLAAARGLSGRLIFVGVRNDIPRLLQAVDAGVLASHYESSSNAILEYLAAGLPVVVTDVGGAREAVKAGRDGFVVEARRPDQLAGAMRELLAFPGGPRAWADAHGTRLDERFHLTHMVRAHERLYESVLGKRAGETR